jgi:hypothetical protein
MKKPALSGLDALIPDSRTAPAPHTAPPKPRDSTIDHSPALNHSKRSGHAIGAVGRPKKNFTDDGLPAHEMRASVIVDRLQWDKLRCVAYWERKKQKTILEEALGEYLRKYESKNNGIKPIPPDADI